MKHQKTGLSTYFDIEKVEGIGPILIKQEEKKLISQKATLFAQRQNFLPTLAGLS
jgi:hypothetical protein